MAITAYYEKVDTPLTGIASIIWQGLTTWGDVVVSIALPGVKKYKFGNNYSLLPLEELMSQKCRSRVVEEPNRALARAYVEGRPEDIIAEAAHRLKRIGKFDETVIREAMRANPYFEPWMEDDITGLIDMDANEVMY